MTDPGHRSDYAEALERAAQGLFLSENHIDDVSWESLHPADRAGYHRRAGAVVDALGLRQVGWWCSNGKPYLILGPDIHDRDGHTHEPVYRLGGQS